MEFGKKLLLLRKEKNISQENLAESIHVSRQAISKWEQGITVPDTDNIVQLSKFFQIPIEYLLLDEYDSLEQVQSAHIQKPTIFNDTKNVFFIIGGLILEVLAICLTYVMQFYDMQINGSCFTNPFNYLWHLPLILIVIMGIICVVVGGVMKKYR